MCDLNNRTKGEDSEKGSNRSPPSSHWISSSSVVLLASNITVCGGTASYLLSSMIENRSTEVKLARAWI